METAAATDEPFDVAIVGGGPAGLSAALVLGRTCRRVVLVDEGKPRNSVSHAMHGFLSRDGMPPDEFLAVSRQQLAPYDTVRLLEGRIEDARRIERGFELATSRGERLRARKLIVATGLVDQLPDVPGLRALYGERVFSCPFCDGWERRNEPLAVLADAKNGAGLALELLVWSRDLVLCANGQQIASDKREQLERNGIAIRDEPVVRLDTEGDELLQIVFADGPPLARSALFVCANPREASDLPRRLGHEGWSPENCEVGKRGRVDVPGVFVIGDASRDVLQVVIAAAEGCEAAMAVNAELAKEDLL